MTYILHSGFAAKMCQQAVQDVRTASYKQAHTSKDCDTSVHLVTFKALPLQNAPAPLAAE